MTFFISLRGKFGDSFTPSAFDYPGPIVQNPQLLPVRKIRPRDEPIKKARKKRREKRDEETFIFFLLETVDDD